MVWKKSQISVAVFSIALSLQLAPFDVFPTQAGETSARSLPQPSASVTFEPPNDETLDTAAAGASRSGGFCPQDNLVEGPSLTPLLPNTQQGLTVSDRPTLFAYLPKTSATQAYFIVKDKTEDYYYQTTVSIPNGGGIVSLQLPDEAPALEMGKNYKWSLVIACELPLRADSPRVEGWLQRVEPTPNLIGYVGKAASIEAATSYGAEGMWYDAVATLAELRRSQPQQYAQTWEEFLTSVGLEKLAGEPLLQP